MKGFFGWLGKEDVDKSEKITRNAYISTEQQLGETDYIYTRDDKPVDIYNDKLDTKKSETVDGGWGNSDDSWGYSENGDNFDKGNFDEIYSENYDRWTSFDVPVAPLAPPPYLSYELLGIPKAPRAPPIYNVKGLINNEYDPFRDEHIWKFDSTQNIDYNTVPDSVWNNYKVDSYNWDLENQKEGIKSSCSDTSSEEYIIIEPKYDETDLDKTDPEWSTLYNDEMPDLIISSSDDDSSYDENNTSVEFPHLYYIGDKIKEDLSPSSSEETTDDEMPDLIPWVDNDLLDTDVSSSSEETTDDEMPDLIPWVDTDLLDTDLSDTDFNTSEEDIGEGSLKIIIGPMFSGKSTRLIFKLTRMADVGFRVAYITHLDTNNRKTESRDDAVTTHNSQFKSLSSKITPIVETSLSKIDIRNFDFIGIDEASFFNDLYESVLTWVTGYGKNVIVASLDGDAYRRKFGQVLDLIPDADKIKKLTAFCEVCKITKRILVKAPFTGRLTNNENCEAKVIGGKNMYMAMCRGCHDIHLTETALY